MSIKLKYTDIPVHKWQLRESQSGTSRKTSSYVLERQDGKGSPLKKVFDLLEPLVQNGAAVVLEHRVVNAKPVTGLAYDVIDITVTQ